MPPNFVRNSKGFSLVGAVVVAGLLAIVVSAIMVSLNSMGKMSAREKAVASADILKVKISELLKTADSCSTALIPASGQFSYDGTATATINFQKIQIPGASSNPLISNDPLNQANKIAGGLAIAQVNWSNSAPGVPPVPVTIGGTTYNSYTGNLTVSFKANTDIGFFGGNITPLTMSTTILTNPLAGNAVSKCFFGFSPQAVCAHNGGTFNAAGSCVTTFYNNIVTNTMPTPLCNPQWCPAGTVPHVTSFDRGGAPGCACEVRGH